VFLDATYLKARVDGRVVSRAVVIATGVTADGGREVLGLDVGDSEDGAFGTAFLRSLKARGLTGVQLVVSDAHTGLKAAITAVMAGASWQRCRVHFLRNVLARVPRGSAEMVAAAIRTIFAQPTGAEVVDQVDKVAAMLAGKFPAVATMLTDAREDLTAFAAFPPAHWTKIWSTNPLERVNKRSSAARMWSGSSLMTPPCSGWPARCCSRPTTSGRSPSAATCQRARWPSSPTPAMMPPDPRR
jgi:putative transposase